MIEWRDINILNIDEDIKLENYGQNVWWNCVKCGKSYEMSPKTKILYHKRN